MYKYSNSTQNKIGNVMRYITKETSAPLTKLIKLMYFMEEAMVKKYGIPFLGLSYEVWKYGPVNKDIYVSLTSRDSIFSDFITMDIQNPLLCVGKFEDDEFSDAELEIMKETIDRLGNLTAHQLVNRSHRKDSLWYKIAKQEGVYDSLISENQSTTDLKIDLSTLLPESKRAFYNECLDVRLAANEARANAGV